VSVRRLADESVQPNSFEFTSANLKWAKETIRKYPKGKQASAVIPVLWRAQEQNDGWVSRAAMEEVGKMLDMPYIRVYEIATFYTMFQLEPVGKKAHVQVCGTTPCMLRGSEELMKVCKRKIAEQPHTLSADGNFSWEEVECLGACVNAPMIQIWKDTYEDLTPEALEDLLDKIANGPEGQAGSADRPHQFRSRRRPNHADRRCDGKAGEEAGERSLRPRPRRRRSRCRRPTPRRPKQEAAITSKAIKSPAKKPAKAAAARKAAAKGKAGRPRALTKPKGKADDLKLISGVGPKLKGRIEREQTLNKLGFWHFSPGCQVDEEGYRRRR
jgi:NADH-quinone oxidoreductase subunit E